MPKHSGIVAAPEETGGVTKTFHRMHDGEWAYEATQDCSAIADANAEARNHINTWSPSKELKHVARIPPVWILKFLNEYGVDVFSPADNEKVNQLLDDPEFSWMKTSNDTLARRRVSKAEIERRLASRQLREAI